MANTPLNILKKYWDYHTFRPLQEEIITNSLHQKDSFVLLPTGGGKSICYQIPALLQEGICLVISPLIALMKDQVQNLQKKGIKAIALDSSLNYQDLDRELNNCLYGSYKFMYLSPERLQSKLVTERLKNININLIAVDEAHCISQWGNDFRPAYNNIQAIRNILPKVPVMALTGSAKPKVVNDIVTNLALNNPKLFKSSFKRKNLAYMVLNTENKQGKLIQILKKNQQASIVYVRNRAKTKQLSEFLQEQDISASYYHGGLSTNEKEQHFKLWRNNQVQVMVATNAFGMGIDKADVKTVIHLSPTENIENYYQEAGRAGRNNKKAYAIILKSNEDIDALKNQITNALPSVKELKFIYRKLCSYLGIAYHEGQGVTYDFNIYEFCKHYQFNIAKTITAITFLDRQEVLRFSKEFKNKTSLRFLVDNYNLIHYISKHKEHNTLINFILRSYGGTFESTITIDLNYIQTKTRIPKESIKEQLIALEKNKIINLQLFNSDISITLLEPREDDRTINRVSLYLKQQNNLKIEQFTAVAKYLENTTTCKEQLLLNYFGEQTTNPCGICSFCIAEKIVEKETNINNLHERIITLLAKHPLSSTQLEQQLQCTSKDILHALRMLLDASKIKLLANNKFAVC